MSGLDRRSARQKIVFTSVALVFTLVILTIIIILSRTVKKEEPLISSTGEASSPIVTVQRPAPPFGTPTPGLIVYGTVKDQNGKGVENASIYRSYSSYPGVVIATTDPSGYYESDFYAIPGDEMISIWAEKAGLLFNPQYCHWRHYYGFEQTECDFRAN